MVLLGDPENRIKRKEKSESVGPVEKDEEIRIKTDVNIIPFILRVLYPNLSEAEFKKLSEQDRVFMGRTTFVCEECYLYISQTSQYCGLNLKPFKQKGLLGTNDLAPEKLKRKEKKTQREENWQAFLKRSETHQSMRRNSEN